MTTYVKPSPGAASVTPNPSLAWGAFAAQVRKDLVLYLANRRALLMGLVAPIVIAAFFGYLFETQRAAPSRIPVAVIDLDGSALSKQLVAALRADNTIVLTELPAAEAAASVLQGQQRAAIVLPAGLGERAPGALFGVGTKPEITLHYDPSQGMVLPLVHGLLAQHLMAAAGQSVMGGGTGSTDWLARMRSGLQANPGLPDERRRDLQALLDSVAKVQQPPTAAAATAATAASGAPAQAASTPGFSMPLTTRELAATAKQDQPYNSFAHSFAGMGVHFILLMGIEFGMALLLMRRQGLWQRLRAAPVSRSVLLGSRIASAAIIAFGLLLAVFLAARLLFGVTIQGSAVGFVGIAAAFALLTASFGLLIAALGKTPEATRGLAILATLLMVMLGGAWVPSFSFPEWLQTVSLAVPTRWAVDGLDAMTWRGLGLQAALAPIGVMLAFTAGFTALALWRFDWHEG